MNLKWFFYGVLFFLAAHIVTWFQLNGQFLWKFFKDNTFILALTGVPISYLYIWGTKFTVESFGMLWPARFVGFGVGIAVYALFIGIFFKEGITLKTFVSLILAFSLVCIQVLWKN
tara:strand:- start:755 stop:1102 length:348 start_codon:yes stop_codon:yes gene_type:complete